MGSTVHPDGLHNAEPTAPPPLAVWAPVDGALSVPSRRAAEPGPWVVGATTEPIWAPGRGEHWGETVFERGAVYPQTMTIRGTHIASKSEQPRMVADMARGYTRSRHEPTADHIARWDPARVLAECAAKKAIVEGIRSATSGPVTEYYVGPMMTTDSVLRLLARPYRDREGYRQEWDIQ